MTEYHSKYFAHEITRQASREGADRLSMALFDANVDLNPHQIEAALFALRSPVSKGVILADEVGLGKTIEAALVLCQLWAERKRRLLVICPASLRKQWTTELEEKFNLPATILDAKSFNAARREGRANPFELKGVVVCSMHFAARMQAEVSAVPWNLVVVDEAHKLRNAHQPANKMGQAIRQAISAPRKILLTATPLQNSLMELYGMSSVIDEYMFGEPSAFRSLYCGQDPRQDELRERLAGFCKRTLRKDVLEYVQYTQRRPITQRFKPTDDEHRFYEAISEFLQRPDTFSIPARQQVLLTLRLRKILASSSPAVAGTLRIMRQRLADLKEGIPPTDFLGKIIAGEDLEDDDLTEELEDVAEAEEGTKEIDVKKLDAEIQELDRYILWASSFGVDTKSKSLLTALKIGFEMMEEKGAARKALVFTESRRTQEYLKLFLESNGYVGKVVTFNGSNTDPDSRKLTDEWKAANAGTGRIQGSRDVDARTAIIDRFADSAEIMVATEAAAEGVNLQFCSMVVNYDMPWNPQRIEQRIGRCHRYGQKHDVVVVNFVNERNDADIRTFELLAEKFELFEGVFGASDEVLGSIESGVDFERRILEIHQTCRTPEDIEASFRTLREELDASITQRMTKTRQMLLEFFDEDIHQRLRMQLEGARQRLDRIGRRFWSVTRYVLRDVAEFDEPNLAFDLREPPVDHVHPGRYRLISKDRDNVEGDFLFRLSHPLGEHVVESAKSLPTPYAEVRFDITNHPAKITVVEELKGRSGWLVLDKLTIDSFEREEYLLLSAIKEDGESLDAEVLERFFNCAATVVPCADAPPDKLQEEAQTHANAAMHRSMDENDRFMKEERDRLEKWADDLILAAERELRDVKAQLKEAKRQDQRAATTEERLALQTKIRDLELRQRRQRQRIFEVEDEIMEKRDQLIGALEKRMRQRTSSERLFQIRWGVV